MNNSPLNIDYINDNVSKKLINIDHDVTKRNENEVLFSNRQIMFEQYKLLIDSSHKIEERRNGSNSIFLGINTILASFLIRPSQLSEIKVTDLPLLILLILIGIFISWDWLKVTNSYKQLNSINYYLIKSFEKILPTFVFSLRAEIEVAQIKQKTTRKANVILVQENILPKIFMLFYCIYFSTIIIMLIIKIF